MAAEQVYAAHCWAALPPEGLLVSTNNQVIQPAPPVPLYSMRPPRTQMPSKKQDEFTPSTSSGTHHRLHYDLEALDSLLASSLNHNGAAKKTSVMPGTSKNRGRPKGSLNKKESRHSASNSQNNAADNPKMDFDPSRMSEMDDRMAVGERSEVREYKCKLCPLRFFSRSDVVMHSRAHTEGKPHKCAVCGKGFASTSYLNQHARIHTGVKPYRCSFCEKSFRQLSHLQQHTRTHTGQRPYRCSYAGCEKAFTQLSNLQQHWRRHNKDKPYKCPDCYRAYDVLEKLQSHVLSHENTRRERKYACSVCGKTYVQELYLEKHLLSKHPQEQGGTTMVMEHDGLPSQVPYKRLPSTSSGSSATALVSHDQSHDPSHDLVNETPPSSQPQRITIIPRSQHSQPSISQVLPRQLKVEGGIDGGEESGGHGGGKENERTVETKLSTPSFYPQVHFPLFNAGYHPQLPGFTSLRS